MDRNPGLGATILARLVHDTTLEEAALILANYDIEAINGLISEAIAATLEESGATAGVDAATDGGTENGVGTPEDVAKVVAPLITSDPEYIIKFVAQRVRVELGA